MGYFKRVQMNVQEAILQEAVTGFDSSDEMREVFLEISEIYNIPLFQVYSIYFQIKSDEQLSALVN